MAAIDTERFRLRRFVERLVQLGECEMHDQPIDLIDVGAVLDGNPRATWFKAVGPEKAELIGNVMGSRKRLALAPYRRPLQPLRRVAEAGVAAGEFVCLQDAPDDGDWRVLSAAKNRRAAGPVGRGGIGAWILREAGTGGCAFGRNRACCRATGA